MNTVEHKTAHKSICARLLQRSEKDRNAFLAKITGDETWVHHYDQLENKINGMASSGVATQKKIKIKTSADTGMASVFWDREEPLLM
jgi:hypothetical protein